MKSEIVRGEGIQGMRITLNVCDMFAAGQVADELQEVIENHKNCDSYAKCPYDKRNEQFPDGQPKRIELSEKTLENVRSLMNKLSFEAKSTLFGLDEDVDLQNDVPLLF
jgi:hypothetical protein